MLVCGGISGAKNWCIVGSGTKLQADIENYFDEQKMHALNLHIVHAGARRLHGNILKYLQTQHPTMIEGQRKTSGILIALGSWRQNNEKIINKIRCSHLHIFGTNSGPNGIEINLPNDKLHRSRSKNSCLGMGKFFSNESAKLFFFKKLHQL